MSFKCSMPRCKDFLLDHEEPKKLVQCRWQVIHPTIYLMYRYLLMIYTLMFLIYGLTFASKFSFIYLTIWGYVILTLNFLVRGIVTSRYFHWVKKDEEDTETTGLIQRPPVEGLPWSVQFAWLLTNVATPIGICITIIFWAALYPVMSKDMLESTGNIQLHAINSVLLLIDFCVVAVPIRMVHIYQPATFGIAYISFNAIYWALGGLNPHGGKAIYPITNWDKPEQTTYAILACIGLLIVVQIILVLLTRLLDHISTGTNSARTNYPMRRSEQIEI